jgi:glutaredoxin 3
MNTKRKVEVFSAGCTCCEQTVARVRRTVCPSCEIEVLDMRDPAIAAKADRYGVRTNPAIAVDGRVAA